MDHQPPYVQPAQIVDEVDQPDVAPYQHETFEADTTYAVSRSGVVEAVREVLPSQVEAQAVLEDESSFLAGASAEDEPPQEHPADRAPSTVVSPRALAAEGYPVPTEAEVAALFDRWNAALQTGDPQEVVALYTRDATLLPTMSPNFCDDTESKIAYFTDFLAKKPWGTVTRRRIYRGHGIAVDTGHYTFHLALTGDDVAARYTYTYVWDGAQWMITNHHSSAAPRPA